MNAKTPIKSILHSTQHLLNWYVSDLSDADLLVRPVPNSNHIAWQLGHLISAEAGMCGSTIPGAIKVELPAGFKEKHTKDTAMIDPPKGFLTKAEYLALFETVRAATFGTLEKMSDADLEKPTTGNMAKFCPTLMDLLLLQGNHAMMHVGYFTAVRRKLGKPVLF
jgi:hypothetical protein